MDGSFTSNPSQDLSSLTSILPIPPHLKFLLSNIKNLVPNPLSTENYPIWRSQVEKIFIASGFRGFLDGSSQASSPGITPDQWEFLDQTLAAADLIWLRQLLAELSCTQDTPTRLYCDNTSAIALAHNPVFHARTKHIEVDCHFIRECITNQTLQVHHIATQDQLADIFTKALPSKRFQQLTAKLTSGIPSSACEGVLTNALPSAARPS